MKDGTYLAVCNGDYYLIDVEAGVWTLWSNILAGKDRGGFQIICPVEAVEPLIMAFEKHVSVSSHIQQIPFHVLEASHAALKACEVEK